MTTRAAGLVLLVVLLGAAAAGSAVTSYNVGYRRIDLQETTSGEPFPVALWYPTRATPAPLLLTAPLTPCRLPVMLCRLIAFELQVAADAPPADGQFGLVVISHGSNGLALNHRDLAMALTAHGYVVAALTHPRGTGNDVAGIAVWAGRPRQVSRVIDAVLADAALGPRVTRRRIGVVGHSNGGFTALAVAGAQPSPAASVAHCRQHPDDVRFCSFGGAAARDSARAGGDIPDVRDARVRAIVLMAPNALPFSSETLARLTVPVRIYGAELDELTLVRYHAERLAQTLPPGREYVLVRGAGHFSFIARYPWALTFVVGDAARDPKGFDRDALHATLNPEIVDFFDRALAR